MSASCRAESLRSRYTPNYRREINSSLGWQRLGGEKSSSDATINGKNRRMRKHADRRSRFIGAPESTNAGQELSKQHVHCKECTKESKRGSGPKKLLPQTTCIAHSLLAVLIRCKSWGEVFPANERNTPVRQKKFVCSIDCYVVSSL